MIPEYPEWIDLTRPYGLTAVRMCYRTKIRNCIYELVHHKDYPSLFLFKIEGDKINTIYKSQNLAEFEEIKIDLESYVMMDLL